ncbi:hypothetical protein ETD83_07740 [Actinomadura soli]|uniref:Leucine-binding protein domain-containing protein n=1 Tax=Actinomadura soli TaxID=2508997 RepID=A0A5C4JGR3_9ACTN|nr:hypothetical protein ETD83_07740 [Actinomadura soli]
MSRIALLTVGACVVAGTVGCSAAGQSSSEKDGRTVYIGAMFDLTGPFAPVGTAERQAFTLAVAQAERDTGIRVRTRVEDSRTSPDTAVKITREFLRDKVSAIVGPTPTQLCDPAHRLTDASRTPMFCITPFPEKTTPSLFLVDAPRVTLVGDVPARFMQKRGWRRVACIYTADAGGKGYADAINQAAPKYGLKVVASESFQQGDTDLTAQLTKIRAAKPDVVYSCSSGANLIAVLKGMAQLRMAQPVFAGHASVNYDIAHLAAPNLPPGGLFSDASPVLIPDQVPSGMAGAAKAKQFADAYVKAHGGKRPDTVAGYVADTVAIIAQAAKAAGSTDRKSLARQIEKTCGYEGVLGRYCFSPANHRGLASESNMIVRWTPTGTFTLTEVLSSQNAPAPSPSAG